jgi:hypothetical protein
MASRYKFFRTIWNDDIKHTQKGFPDIELYDYFNYNDDRNYRVPLKYEYRPDLISLDFYGDPKLYWVLVYANGFYNSPQDFNSGRIIKVPRYERVVSLI